MTLHERIESRPDVMFGKPVIKGTRIPVEQVLRKRATGMTSEQILEKYPRLTQADILAAEAFAADYLEAEAPGVRQPGHLQGRLDDAFFDALPDDELTRPI
jgi:uncharacterized protein (DUF433 family)